MKNYTKALAEQIVAVMDRYNNYEELEKIVICYGTVVVSRWCICNAKCHCRNTPAGYSSNFNTAALLGDIPQHKEIYQCIAVFSAIQC